VTVTFTLLPGLMLADPGLTDVMSAEAGVLRSRSTVNPAAIGRSPRIEGIPVQLNVRDLNDRTMTPDDLALARRIRHEG
jgi:hypothetical protein